MIKNLTKTHFILAIFATALGTMALAAFLMNIFERKSEAKNPFYRVVELDDTIEDPAIWGKNFPLQYDGYKRTVDMTRTKFGGSEAWPHEATDKDPRKVVSNSRLEEDPRLKNMWAGYAFSVDFREERGHAYMLEDQTYTERQHVVKQPGTCMNCHASTYTLYNKLGNGDVFAGFEKLNSMPYSEARPLVNHPVACIDCHNPKTMELRVTRPAFMEGMKAYKASLGIKNYDVNKDATRQEMRSYVCGQCHVEYYFKGDKKRLTYPWNNGLKADQILSYYEENGHKDFIHKDSQAPVLKAQHPEFELWSQGVHARSGVACADCHMPYTRVGSLKISDHHIQSPLLNIQKACQTCHRIPEAEIKARAEDIQARVYRMRGIAMDSLLVLIADLKANLDKNLPEAQIKMAQNFQRKAQFLLDFIEAENSTGFHAPQEALRILGESIDYSRQGQLALKNANYKPYIHEKVL